MRQVIYRIVYSPTINWFIRNLIKYTLPFVKGKKTIPVSGTLSINTKGHKLLIRTNPTSFASKHIFWDGINNFEYVPIFKLLIEEVNVFLDIGANTGIYSTLGAVLNKNLMVHGFEPSRGPCAFFEKNIKVNGLENRVYAHELALSNQSGETKFYYVSNRKYKFLEYNLGGVGNLKGKISHRYMKESIVKVDTLDSFVEKKDLNQIDLIKIDTEATEDLVLMGMLNTLQKFKPILICEVLFNRIESKVEEIVRRFGYQMYWHDQDNQCLVPTDTLRREQDNGYRDVFMATQDKVGYLDKYVC